MRALVAGWFSFEGMGATAGDLLARDVACDWLRRAGLAFDVAHASPFEGGVDWEAVDPDDYSHVVFVCGPFGNASPVTHFLARFRARTLVGLDLTMVEPIDDWNPFDLLVERDSRGSARPDLSLLAPSSILPLVGIILVHDQPVPGAMHAEVRACIERVTAGESFVPIRLDTRLDVPNEGGLTTAAQVESLIARMDAVITMRMHGMVLALKNGIPAVALDPIKGGHKVTRQAGALGWDVVLTPGELTDDALTEALESCLTEDARARARSCTTRATAELEQTRQEFISSLRETMT